MSIRPSSWRVAITKHERWEQLSPSATRGPSFVGYEWRCEGEVEGVRLPFTHSFYRFRLLRPNHTPLEWIGIFHRGEANENQELTAGEFHLVDDGRFRREEGQTSSEDPGAVLELWPVVVEHATGRLVDAPFTVAGKDGAE